MIGPHGEKRPADVIENAIHVAKVLTRERDEEYVDEDRRRGGFARAENLTPERRRELARKAAEARWSKENE